jgi:hypothetical protein
VVWLGLAEAERDGISQPMSPGCFYAIGHGPV